MNQDNISSPNSNDTPRSLFYQFLIPCLGSDQRISHNKPILELHKEMLVLFYILPSYGISIGRLISIIWLMFFNLGDSPP